MVSAERGSLAPARPDVVSLFAMKDESTRSRVSTILAGEGVIIHALVALLAAYGAGTLWAVLAQLSRIGAM